MFSRDETLKKAYVLLTFFNRDKDSIRLTQPLLSVLNYLDAGTPEDIAALRTEIKSWIKNNPQTAARIIDSVSLHDALHSFLIAMAAAKPINIEDPVTQDAVAESKRIVTSEGYQFDAESLLTWIKTKGKIVNPLTNLIFAEKDQQGIIAYAAENMINIAHAYTAPDQEDPGLLRSAIAAMNPDQRPSLFREDLDITPYRWPTRQGSIYRPAESSRSYAAAHSSLFPGNHNHVGGITISDLENFPPVVEESRFIWPSRRIGLGYDFNLGQPTFFRSGQQHRGIQAHAFDGRSIRNDSCMRWTAGILEPYGLTIDYLRSHWQGSDGVFDEFVSDLLIYLVTGSAPGRNENNWQPLLAEQRLSHAQAIDQINGLTYNEFRALGNNYAYGLRKNHLLSWRSLSIDIYFGQGHRDALTRMMGEQHLSPEEAIQRISGLTQSQAWDIYRGQQEVRPRSWSKGIKSLN